MTKKAQRFVQAYERSTYSSISQCYKSHSRAKELAERACRARMIAQKGWDFRILSYNTTQFTCGWQTPDKLHVETRDNSYVIPYDNLPF